MLRFQEKTYAEHDAMKYLFNEMYHNNVRGIETCTKENLIPILKGNNIVLEKFVISTSFFGKDKFRAYFKLGAKVTLPSSVRLPGMGYPEKTSFGTFKVGANSNINQPNFQPTISTHSSVDSDSERFFSELQFEERQFGHGHNGGGNNKNQNQKKKNKGGGGGGFIKASWQAPDVRLEYDSSAKPLAETIKYDRVSRSLVLEYDNVGDVFRSFWVLPFGIRYNLYILEP